MAVETSPEDWLFFPGLVKEGSVAQSGVVGADASLRVVTDMDDTEPHLDLAE